MDRNATLNVLTSGNKDELLDKIQSKSNNKDNVNNMSFRFTDKIGNFNELVMVSDSKYMLQVKPERSDNDNDKLIASFSNEEHQILVQEIMFEKQWNEVNGLAITTTSS